MHNEIAAATSHLSTLLVAAAAPSTTTTSSSPPSSSILAAWQQTLSTTLQASLSHSGNWYPTDPERGSAARALHWQPLAGGEGCSTLLLDACRKHGLTFAASQWTLWIDPSCVAIRMGPGPGRTTSGSGNAADFGSAAAMSAANFTDGIKVIYGSLPMPRIVRSPAYTHAQVHAPSQHALFAPATSKAAVISRPQAAGNAGNRVPSVTVSPSTPSLDRTAIDANVDVQTTALESADATPVVPWTSTFAAGSLGLTGLGLGPRRRARRSSSSSSTSSSGSGGSSNVSRDSSSSRGLGALEATSSVGTSLPASSPPATWDKLGDDEVPEPQDGESVDDAVVPSAPAPAPLSLRNVDLLGLGLEDCGLDEADSLGPEDAISVTGHDADADADAAEEDERDGEGDDTIRSLDEADETICATVAEEQVVPSTANATATQQQARSTTTTSRHSRTSSTVSSASSSVTSFDNGNVGVLGGGVKLGGASSSSASSASSATGGRRSRAMSGTSNHSGSASSRASLQHSRTLSRTGGWAAQQQREVQMQMQGGWWQQQQQPQYAPQQWTPQTQQHQQQQQHFQYPAPPQQQGGGSALGLNNMAAPPAQYARQQQVYEFQPVPQHQSQQHSSSSFPPAPPLEIVPLYKRREAGPPSQQKFSINVTLATADEAPSRMPIRPASATSTSPHDGSGSKFNNNGNGCLTPNSATLAPLASPALSSTGSTASSYGGGETDDGGDDNDSDVEGEGEGEDDEQDGIAKPRRTRTRGRRSRGRGAGRAARRAAAAAAAAAATAACLPPGVAGSFPTPPVGAFGSPAVGASPMMIGGAWGKPLPLPSPTGASPFLQQQQQQRMMFNNNNCSSPQMQMSGMGSPALHQHAVPPRPAAFNRGGARPQHPLQQQQQQHQRMMPPPQYAQQQFGTPSLAAPQNGGGW